MESQSLLAYSEKGVTGLENYWIEGKGLDREGSPSINLRLGIGAPINEGRRKPTIFTAEQLHEFNYQTLIFKYIVAGLFVPFHLVFPIWESFPCSFRSANGGNYNQYPSFLGFSSQGLNQRTMMMDPEPGRCRRTDGKKWRCTKNVVPDLKYCERHMHRGHQRSRKHVEASQNILQSDKTTKSTTPAIDCCNTSNTNTKFSIPVPPNLYLSTHSSNTKNSDSYTKRTDISNDSKYSVSIGMETAGKTTGASLNIEQGTSRNNSNNIDGKDDGFIYTDNRSIYNGSKSKFARIVTPGFGSSPRSILQGGTAVGGSTLGFDNRTLLETEPNRCRRTDGKKWRCSHEVVPDHKYCGRHIHRGAKRTKVPSEMVTVAAPPPTPLAMPEKANDCINLNTQLSISIPSRPQRTSSNEGHYTSASSSEATTISDENASVADASIPSLENM